jgi:hypothetical protein
VECRISDIKLVVIRKEFEDSEELPRDTERVEGGLDAG